MPSRIVLLAAALTALWSLPASAADTARVHSAQLVLSRQEDGPVVRGIIQARPGAPFTPRLIATDLYKLGLLGYRLARFEARPGPHGVAIDITASHADRPTLPKLKSVRLTGGIAEIDALCRTFLTQRPSTLFRDHTVDYYGMVEDIDTIQRAYRARGRLDARVAALTCELRTDGTGADLTFRINPGTEYRLGKVTAHGRQVNAQALLKALGLKGSPPWTAQLKAELARRATRFCTELGYLEARTEAVPKKRPDGTVDVRLDLTEGDRSRLNRVVIEGAGHLQPAVRKQVTLQKDQPVSRSQLDAIRRSIENLGSFTRIETQLVPLKDGPAGLRDLVIQLTPADLNRKIGPGEQLYYEMARQVVRLHNRGETELRSLRASGFVRRAKKRVAFKLVLVRPDYAHLAVTLPPEPAGGPRPAQTFEFISKGGRAAVRVPGFAKALPLPRAAALRLELAIEPADPELDRPARIRLGAAVTRSGTDVLLLGERCPPVAVYATRTAMQAAKKPPRLEAPDLLVLPAVSDAGTIKIRLGPDKLPRRITQLTQDGEVTGQADIEINPTISDAERTALPADFDPKDAAAGAALAAPALAALGLPEVAADLADQATADHPHSAPCRAARGLMRLAFGPPDPGLADLRTAAKQSSHPAYRLLLIETLVRAKRFTEAKPLCRDLLGADLSRRKALHAADLLLEAGISLRGAIDTLLAGPSDYRRRATVDAALVHIGLTEYAQAANLAQTLLKAAPDDRQAGELLARCELSLGRPEAALRTLAKLPTKTDPRLALYTALAHHALGQDDPAAKALAVGLVAAPRLRNLLTLHHEAGRILPRYRTVQARAALARLFHRATVGTLDPKLKATLAAVVNDAYVLKPDVDKLSDQLARGRDLKPDERTQLRARALLQIIDDMLVLRWAAWRGLRANDQDVRNAMRSEMERLGVRNVEEYKKRLAERGSSLVVRAREIREGLLKRQALTTVIADEVRVRPSEVRAYYAAHPEQFKLPPSARLRMITLHYVRYPSKEDALRTAAGLLRRIRAKPDRFDALARQYSHDANAARGGLWSDVPKGSMVKPLDAAIFTIEAGQTSDVIETPRSCHIVRVEKMLPERLVPLERAAPDIVRAMQEARARLEVALWLKELKAVSYIKVFDE